MRNSLIAGTAAALILSAGTALAQQQPQPAGQQPELPKFDQPEWTKICAKTPDGKDTCQTVRDLLAPTAAWMMTAQVGQEKGGKPKLTVIIPAGVVLPLGARVLVDDQTLDTAKYRICTGPSCIADMPLSDANVASLKKGKKLKVQAITFQGQPIGMDIGLDGLGKALDGQGIDQAGYAAKQKDYGEKLQAIFQPLIDAQRKQQQQQGGGGAPATPPAQPAAPAQ
ncbi:invasion associated locus B family protein [Labrys neptuniae]